MLPLAWHAALLMMNGMEFETMLTLLIEDIMRNGKITLGDARKVANKYLADGHVYYEPNYKLHTVRKELLTREAIIDTLDQLEA